MSLKNYVYELESMIRKMENDLSEDDWRDSVKESYCNYVCSMRNDISSLEIYADKADRAYGNMFSDEYLRIRSELEECSLKLKRLQGG